MNRKLKIQIAEQVRQIKATLRYSAVRPASGITYTLLVLINDSIDKTVPVEKILVSFGIEKHVHHIFAAELENLITGRAVEISPSSVFTGFFKEKFSEYRIADFNLTAAGKVLLEEKQAPTGQDKNLRLNFTYSSATRNFSLANNLPVCSDEEICSHLENNPGSFPYSGETLGTELKLLAEERRANPPVSLTHKEIIYDVTPYEQNMICIFHNAELEVDLEQSAVLIEPGSDAMRDYISRTYDESLVKAVFRAALRAPGNNLSGYLYTKKAQIAEEIADATVTGISFDPATLISGGRLYLTGCDQETSENRIEIRGHNIPVLRSSDVDAMCIKFNGTGFEKIIRTCRPVTAVCATRQYNVELDCYCSLAQEPAGVYQDVARILLKQYQVLSESNCKSLFVILKIINDPAFAVSVLEKWCGLNADEKSGAFNGLHKALNLIKDRGNSFESEVIELLKRKYSQQIIGRFCTAIRDFRHNDEVAVLVSLIKKFSLDIRKQLKETINKGNVLNYFYYLTDINVSRNFLFENLEIINYEFFNSLENIPGDTVLAAVYEDLDILKNFNRQFVPDGDYYIDGVRRLDRSQYRKFSGFSNILAQSKKVLLQLSEYNPDFINRILTSIANFEVSMVGYAKQEGRDKMKQTDFTVHRARKPDGTPAEVIPKDKQ